MRFSFGVLINFKSVLTYPASRVEAACKKAFHFGLFRYRNVKNILDKNLENDFIEQKLENKIVHENIRGAKYYKEELC